MQSPHPSKRPRSPEELNASREQLIRERDKFYMIALCAGFLGVVLQGACWGGVMSTDAFGPEAGAGNALSSLSFAGGVGLLCLLIAVALFNLARSIDVPPPASTQRQLEAELEAHEARILEIRRGIIRELEPYIRSAFRQVAASAAVAYPQVTNRLGEGLPQLRRHVEVLADRAGELVEREFGRERWEGYFSTSPTWVYALQRIEQELWPAFEQAGYRGIAHSSSITWPALPASIINGFKECERCAARMRQLRSSLADIQRQREIDKAATLWRNTEMGR